MKLKDFRFNMVCGAEMNINVGLLCYFMINVEDLFMSKEDFFKDAKQSILFKQATREIEIAGLLETYSKDYLISMNIYSVEEVNSVWSREFER